MIKQILKKITVFIITLEAKLVLRRYKPRIVAVTGSVGKTSTKDAVAAVLGQKFFVRKSMKSYNSDRGIPLVVLGCESGWLNPFIWSLNILKGLRLIFAFKKIPYPDWLVLEMGVERSGDMEKLTSWIKPSIAVFTAIAEIPPHVEFFSGPEALANEKMRLVKDFGVDRFVILNADDKILCEAKNKIQAKIISYGFGGENDITASNYRVAYRQEDNREIPEGITFKADYKGSSVPVRVFGAFGKQQVYPVLAALAVGLALDFNLVDMGEALSRHKSPPGRMKLIEGVKNTWIIDDTYNASPMAVHAALDVLSDMPASGRKIVVLGDMLELGKYAVAAHKSAGDRASKVADIIFTIGPRAKFISAEAKEQGFDPKKIFEFSTSKEAAKPLENILQEGDLILIKGSQAMRMEKMVEEIMAHPEDKEKLLVRQEKEWLNKK